MKRGLPSVPEVKIRKGVRDGSRSCQSGRHPGFNERKRNIFKSTWISSLPLHASFMPLGRDERVSPRVRPVTHSLTHAAVDICFPSDVAGAMTGRCSAVGESMAKRSIAGGGERSRWIFEVCWRSLSALFAMERNVVWRESGK